MSAHKNLCILQARMGSSRLPGKVMAEINGKPMIFWQIKRIQQASKVHKLIVATSREMSDDILVDFLNNLGVSVYRGSLDDVLSRFIIVSQEEAPTCVIRLTADCPLVMPRIIDHMIKKFYESDVDYLSNTLVPTFPDGLDVEILKPHVFEAIKRFALTDSEREHVTLGIYRRPEVFSLLNFENEGNLGDLRWTVDTLKDLEFVKWIFGQFRGREPFFTFDEVKKLLAIDIT